MHVARDRTVWFGCGDGICRLTPGGIESYGPAQGVPRGEWAGFGSDPSGQVWARNTVGGIRTLPPGTRRFLDSGLNLPGSPELASGPEGLVCVPSDLGLYYRTGAGWNKLTHRQGLSSDAVSACYIDREGSIWLGGFGGGLARWAGYGQWAGWTVAEGLHNDDVRAVTHDDDGNIWLGTDQGLHRLDRAGRIRLWTTAEGLDSNSIAGLAAGEGGDIWVAHAPGGITRLNPRRGRLERYGKAAGLREAAVITVAWDGRERTLWAGTPGGLYQGLPHRGGLRFRKIPLVPDAALPAVIRLALGQEGRVWAACDFGLALRERGAWRVLTVREGLKRNALVDVVEAPGGAVWVAYYSNDGASRLDFAGGSPRITHFDKRSGLSSNVVMFTGVDREGCVWVGTDRGVDVLHGGHWDHYGEAEGLVWDDTNGAAFDTDPHGDVWIGTSRGVARFRHTSPPPRLPFPVRVTAVYAGDRLLTAAELSRVPYRDRSLLFNYTALTFRAGRTTRFRYRMDGLETEWQETGERDVRYAAMPPGSFAFEVQAREPGGGWSEPPARVLLAIQAPWWQSWWVRRLLPALCVLALWSLWRWRVLLLLRRQRELECAVAARTRELTAEREQLLATREELRERALKDGLTGLFNRGAFFELLARELARARRDGHPVAVILADLDHFKKVNDRHGHLAGDAVLEECARRIQASIRSHDMAARYGGEELVVLLPNCDLETAVHRAEKIRQALAQHPVETPAGPVNITCSLGVGATNGHNTSAQDLVEMADLALYAAKRNGRNRVGTLPPRCAQP